MRLLSLSIENFRNISSARLEPSVRSTILIGDNGQGKTNLIEAIYLLATLRPLRAARLAELIRFGTDRAQVQATLETPGGPREAAIEIASGGRSAFLDGKPLGSSDRLETYFESLSAVCFSPDDLLLIKGGPEGRRRFLDRAAFNRWPAVLSEAREYVRALRARNASLRSAGLEVEASFRIPLARAAARLLVRRHALIAELSPRLVAAFCEISGPSSPEVVLSYRPAAGMPASGREEELAASLAEILDRRIERDRERGYTSAGPHMDDLVISLDGRAARAYGSQGQQRALVLSLKIAEIENLRAMVGRPPILLLDDVSSELDPDKNRYLLEYLSRLSTQAFLTTTDRHPLAPAAGPDTVFLKVENGVFSPII